MATAKLTNDIIQAAIDGYEAQKVRIDASLAELRAMLSGAPASKAPVPALAAVAQPGKKKRRLSAAGRKAIADAARKRWAAFNAAKKAAAK